MILTWMIVIPAVGGALAWTASRWSVIATRWIALLACLADLGLVIALWITRGSNLTIAEQNLAWVPQFGLRYHLSMDGLSLLLVTLTALLGALSVAYSWRNITDRAGAFYFSLLILLSGITGVFLSFDLLLFYIFWEIMLVPMYFLVGVWGHEDRIRAAIKFFLFTFIGGLFMLVAIIGLYIAHGKATGVYTFDYRALVGTPLSDRHALWLMLGFFVGFAVKLPVVPLHTWLADTHTEAPTAGSVILAGLLLKTGAYGFLRFAIPLFPSASAQIAPVAMILGTIGILYGGVLTFAQTDFKRMIAYTSVSHMGFVLLGVYSGSALALQGAVVEIIAHGISTGALFFVAGMVQERTHTRELSKLGGLWAAEPRLGGFTLLFALAAIGLPGLGNFIGEFLVLLGTFQVSPAIASVAALGFVVSVIYGTRLVRASVLGPNENNRSLQRLSFGEIAILGILAVVILFIGLYPRPIFTTAARSLETVGAALNFQEGRGM